MESASGAGRCILVVDPDPALRAQLRDRLQLWGFQVVETDQSQREAGRTTSGPAALAIHGVLLALHEPAPDGLSPLHHTRRSYPGIPVIVISDVAHIQVARQAVNLGAQEYVLKPFDQDLLKTKCLRVFAASSRVSFEADVPSDRRDQITKTQERKGSSH